MTLADLRKKRDELKTRAAAKRAEIVAGLADEAVRAIEGDHAKMVTEIEETERAISIAEEAERAAASRTGEHSWSRADVTKITARAKGFGLDASVAMEIMASDTVRSLEQATDALQERAVARQGETQRQQPQIRMVADEVDKARAALEDAIVLRANPQAIVATDQASRDRVAAARQWRGMRLMEMGRAFLSDVHGTKLRGIGQFELAGVLLGMDTLGRAAPGQMSTSDFANLLANVINKRLRDAYATAPQNWKLLGRQSNATDFKQKWVVQLSDAPAFLPVTEGDEFKRGGLSDNVEKYSLVTYGRIISLTRQALINDDMSAFDRLPMMLGRQAAEREASTFWGIFTANAAMSDGVALFHATHGNLMTGSAIDTTNLGLGRAAMRKQKSLTAKSADAIPLNLAPKFLVNSPDKEVEGQQALTAVLAAQSSQVNVMAGSLTQITESRLTGNTWFMVADPALIDTVEYAYLEGEEGLFVEQRIGFDVDGIEIKGRLDFAAKAIDWRGMQKNPGN